MNLWFRRFLSCSLIVLVFPASAAVWDDPSNELWKHYNATVTDSAVYRHENLRRLHPLKFDPQTFTTTVVTLTNDAYPAGVQTLSRAVWVTAVPEVQEKCSKFSDQDLALRLRQLLGLQPDAKFQYFVTMIVKSSDVFRPVTDPTTTTEWPCSDSTQVTCGETFPDWVTSTHVKWIANQMLSSYIILEQHTGSYSYTWTRMV